MSYYIIIRGPLGSGKTTIAEKLAQNLNAEYVGVDEVLEKNGLDVIPPNEPCIPVENFIKANDLIIPSATEKLASGTIVIFDACFYHKEVIENLIKNLSFDHYIFTLKVPVDVCIQRDQDRNKTHGAGAAHAVHGLVSQFDYGTIIDANKSFEETFEDIISYLPDPETSI